MDIRISLRAARVNADLTQKEAAEKLGINAATLFNYESGKTIPGWDMVKKIEDLYKIPAGNISFARHSA